jgi:catechol 2,3-dioxygenase-like lactoylglutathione lyase family enzyme
MTPCPDPPGQRQRLPRDSAFPRQPGGLTNLSSRSLVHPRDDSVGEPRDEFKPLVRQPSDHADGAFVRDPDGNNVEAVCRLPE